LDSEVVKTIESCILLVYVLKSFCVPASAVKVEGTVLSHVIVQGFTVIFEPVVGLQYGVVVTVVQGELYVYPLE